MEVVTHSIIPSLGASLEISALQGSVAMFRRFRRVLDGFTFGFLKIV